MIQSTTQNRRSSRRLEKRTSIESVMSLGSFAKEGMFDDGSELLDFFQNNPDISMNIPEISISSFPPDFCGSTPGDKRPSVKDFMDASGGKIYSGKDLADIFSHPDLETSMQLPDFETSMQMSMPDFGRRLSALSDGINKRESLKDFMILEEPTSTLTATNDKMDHSNNSMKIDNEDDKDKGEAEIIEELRPYDIICGRNNGGHSWVGNRRFRITIMMNLKRYKEAIGRKEKTQVIKSVIDLLTDKNEAGARFIEKNDEGKYFPLNSKQIREKVGHAFRDMALLSTKEGRKLEDKCLK